MAGLAFRFNTAFLVIAMTYSRLGFSSREGEQIGMREAAVEANPNTHTRKKGIMLIRRRRISFTPAQ
jgi:hypothetical protein